MPDWDDDDENEDLAELDESEFADLPNDDIEDEDD